VGRDVVVTVFHERLAADPDFARRFEVEARAIAGLEHPHILPIYDYWREPGHAYVVSRYLRGGSLGTSDGPMTPVDPDEAVRIIEQVADALASVHEQGLVHGDVCAANVVLDAERNAFVAGFAIGAAPRPDPAGDVHELIALSRALLGAGGPPRLVDTLDRVEADPSDGASAIGRAAREASDRPTEPDAAAPGADVRNPYKGLRPFLEPDRQDFFGRAESVERLVERLREPQQGSRFLALVGPSGCGKSSLVRAGLIPELRRHPLGATEPYVAELFPGRHPFDELEAALLRVAVRPAPRLHDLLDGGSRGLLDGVELVVPADAEVVLVVDQLEELYTHVEDAREREAFLEALRVAAVDPESRLRIVATIRADLYDRPLAEPRFGELLAARNEAIPPLTPDQLERAIRGPAERVGVRPDPGLEAEVIADVTGQPGALPLVQYALTELFERREGDRLTLAAYRSFGGVSGALSARADRLFSASDGDGQAAIRQVFLRLVTLGEGRADTRRRVARSELDALDVDGAAVDRTLEAFGRHRLLTFDREPATREPTVEIAHEALLVAWERLAAWIQAARDDLRQERSLASSAADWRAAEQDPSFLLHGSRLELADRWAADTDLALSEDERRFLKASLEQRTREEQLEAERRGREARAERRSRTRLRALVAVLAVAALVAGTLTVISTRQGSTAEDAARVAEARELAAAAVANLGTDAELAVLLATEAVELTRSVDGTILPEAEDALHLAIGASRIVSSVPGTGGPVAWSSTGLLAMQSVDRPGVVDLRDAASGRVLRSIEAHDQELNDVAFSPDGSLLATGGRDGWLKLWAVDTSALRLRLHGRGAARGLAFSEDGSRLVGTWWHEVRVIDVASGDTVATLARRTFDADLDAEGRRVAVSMRGGAAIVDVATGSVVRQMPIGGGGYDALAVSWSPDDRYVAAVSFLGAGQVWNARTGRLRYSLPYYAFGSSVAWGPGSRRVVTGGSDGVVRVWWLGDGNALETMALSTNELKDEIVSTAFSPDGTHLLTGDLDRTAARVWDVGPNGGAEWGTMVVAGFLGDVQFLPDGEHVVASTDASGPGVTVWNLRQRAAVREITPIHGWHWFSVSPDGAHLAAGGEPATVWNLATGRLAFELTAIAGEVPDVDWRPDGTLLALANGSNGAIVVDPSGRVTQVLDEGRGTEVGGVRFSPDGTVLAVQASGADGGHVTLWDVHRASIVRRIPTEDPGFAIDFDPTGTKIVTGGWEEGTAAVWDVATGARLLELGGPTASIMAVAFSPDGSRVAVAGFDRTVRLFDAATGALELTLRHPVAVSQISFSPDGSRLATYTPGVEPDPGLIRVWALDVDDLLALARLEVTRTLTLSECRRYLHLEHCPT
jgi:WD40 repeat protein